MTTKDFAFSAAIAANVLLSLVVANKPSPTVSEVSSHLPDAIALRELTIVDDNGKTRIRLTSKKTELTDGDPSIVLYGSKRGDAVGVFQSVQLRASESGSIVWMQNMPKYLKLTSNGVGGRPEINASE